MTKQELLEKNARVRAEREKKELERRKQELAALKKKEQEEKEKKEQEKASEAASSKRGKKKSVDVFAQKPSNRSYLVVEDIAQQEEQ